MHGICDHPGCQDPSAFRPTVLVRAKRRPDGGLLPGQFFANFVGEDKYCIRYEVLAEYCSYHSDQFRPQKMMDEACWSAIDNQTRQVGLAPPDKDSAEVVWDVAGDEHGRSPELHALLRQGYQITRVRPRQVGVGPGGVALEDAILTLKNDAGDVVTL